MTETSLARETMALVGVMLECLEGESQSAMRTHLAELGLTLLDQVTQLACEPPAYAPDDVDDQLAVLEVQMELAYHLQVLNERDFLDLSRQLDVVQRRLGRWRKTVGR